MVQNSRIALIRMFKSSKIWTYGAGTSNHYEVFTTYESDVKYNAARMKQKVTVTEYKQISGRVDRASATEAVYSG